MKLATFKAEDIRDPRYGFKRGEHVVDILYLSKFLQEKNDDTRFLNLPISLKEALKNWDQNLKKFKMLDNELSYENLSAITKDGSKVSQLVSDIKFLAPIPNPSSFRDFYAFEQHVRSARKLRGLDMHPDWFKIPIFYFSNATAIYGHGAPIPYPKMTQELDFELEFAIIIANGGSDINHKDADEIFLSCTNLATIQYIKELEEQLRKPIITSNQATYWACLRKLGLLDNLSDYGGLFEH